MPIPPFQVIPPSVVKVLVLPVRRPKSESAVHTAVDVQAVPAFAKTDVLAFAEELPRSTTTNAKRCPAPQRSAAVCIIHFERKLITATAIVAGGCTTSH